MRRSGLLTLRKLARRAGRLIELAAEIRGTGATTIKRRGGRKPAIPGSASSIVQKCFSQAQQLYNYLDAVSGETLGRFEELPADEATEKFLEKIDSTVGMLEDTVVRIGEFHEDLKAGRIRVHTIIMNTQAADAEIVEPKKQGPPTSVEEAAVIVEANRRDIMESPQSSVEDLRERTMSSTVAPPKRGRPKGSKNKVLEVSSEGGAVVVGKKKRGRPEGVRIRLRTGIKLP